MTAFQDDDDDDQPSSEKTTTSEEEDETPAAAAAAARRCHPATQLQSRSFLFNQQQQQQQQYPPTQTCDSSSSNSSSSSHYHRKLRVLIITMGGARQQAMEQLFQQQQQQQQQQLFEPPIFRPGVSSRSLRNRRTFLETAAAAGLLPELEWQALQKEFAKMDDDKQQQQQSNNNNTNNNDCDNNTNNNKKKNDNNNTNTCHGTLFDCLQDVPILTTTTTTSSWNRKGNAQDVALHYSVELWRKAKTVNRGRAVLACTLAHLLALKYIFEVLKHDDNEPAVDLVLEDNIRAPIHQMAERIHEACRATQEWEQATGQTCHLRYLGWLGSCTNLEWVYARHIPQRHFKRQMKRPNSSYYTIAPFPMTQDIKHDLEINEYALKHEQDEISCATRHSKPGGTPVWGAYGYWISKQAYQVLLQELRRDVGAMLWKGKRMRFYSVKPIDKIMPRQIISHFGRDSVQIATHPAVFRAPMLTSKIHTRFDPEFCKSTSYQLEQCGLHWSDLWLTLDEQAIVSYYQKHGEWLTLEQLRRGATAPQTNIEDDVFGGCGDSKQEEE